MNVDEKTIDEMQPSPLPSPEKKGEGESKDERPARLRYVPNRHDRRKAAAEARKEAKRKGKK